MVLARSAGVAALTLVTTPIGAQTFGAELDFSYGSSHVQGRQLSPAPGVSAPAALAGKTPYLTGQDAVHGATLRLDLLIDQMRLGGGASLYGVGDDVALETQPPLASGSSIEVRSIRGEGAEVFFGYEFLRGPVYGYFDLRGSFNVLSVDLATGPNQSFMYDAYSFGFGPRLGALVPIGHSTMLDVAVYQRIVGDLVSTVFFLGLGYWQNDRNDPFSEELRRSWRGDF